MVVAQLRGIQFHLDAHGFMNPNLGHREKQSLLNEVAEAFGLRAFDPDGTSDSIPDEESYWCAMENGGIESLIFSELKKP